jgi:hypothetical protein
MHICGNKQAIGWLVITIKQLQQSAYLVGRSTVLLAGDN